MRRCKELQNGDYSWSPFSTKAVWLIALVAVIVHPTKKKAIPTLNEEENDGSGITIIKFKPDEVAETIHPEIVIHEIQEAEDYDETLISPR